MPPQNPTTTQTPEERKAIVQRMIDAGESEENIATVIKHFQSQPTPDGARHGVIQTALDLADVLHSAFSSIPGRETFRTGASFLPAAGGAVGALGAGATALPTIVGTIPAAMGGAAAGGAVGEGLRQGVSRFMGDTTGPVRPLEAAKDMAVSGVTQWALEGIGGVVGQGLAKGAARLAPRLMQSALKPSVAALGETTAAGVPKVVQTMLDEGQPVTANGVRNLMQVLRQTGKQIDTLTANAPGKIPPMETVDRALKLTEWMTHQVNSSQDLKAVADAANQFLEERLSKQAIRAMGHRPMTVAEAQAVKEGTYKALGPKVYSGELKTASIEAQKALATGLKQQIEDLVPEVKSANARYGAVSDALDAVARRVGVTGNKDMGGIFWVAHNPGAFLAAQFDRSPAVKSYLALGLYDQAAKIAGVPPQLLRLAVTSLASEPEPTRSQGAGAGSGAPVGTGRMGGPGGR